MPNTVLIKTTGPVITVTLNRPEAHNAFNAELMRELTETFASLPQSAETRVIVVTGAGKSFSAGADLNFMKSAAAKSHEQNVAESMHLAKLLTLIDECPKPVIALVNGTALGGAMGIISACDIVLAHAEAQFGFSEVKLGMTPSVISPFAVRRLGIRYSRRYFLTGERFGATEAKNCGLADEIYNDATKDAVLGGFLQHFAGNAPNAMAAVKKLARMNWQCHSNAAQRDALTCFTAEQIATLRASEEAQEGMQAFFEKRAPGYAVKI